MTQVNTKTDCFDCGRQYARLRGQSVHLPDWTRPDNNVGRGGLDWQIEQRSRKRCAKLLLTPCSALRPSVRPSVCPDLHRHYARRHKMIPTPPARRSTISSVPVPPLYHCPICVSRRRPDLPQRESDHRCCT